MSDGWMPFELARFPVPTKERVMATGHTEEEAQAFIESMALSKCYVNNL